MGNGTLHLVGIDARIPGNLPVSLLESTPVFVLTSRFEHVLDTHAPLMRNKEIIPISPLAQALDTIQERLQTCDVVVLASGDPLFFGIGKLLTEKFRAFELKVYPALSSVQHTFSYFTVPWHDAAFLSLHGRKEHNFLGKILAHPKIMLLTDGKNRPEIIAGELISFLEERSRQYTACVAENIGMKDERFVSGTLQEIERLRFGGLCCMILQRKANNKTIEHPFGLREDDIAHSRGLITKKEVRAAAIHALQVPDNAIVWDVGAGSGAVGLEISRMSRESLVFSVEKSVEQRENISRNREKFAAFNLKPIAGEAPDALNQLPDPDRVFIGGSGGNLAEIISCCSEKLVPGGRIVVTAVLDKTLHEAPQCMVQCGLEVEIARLEVTRTRYPQQRTTSFNPISIITGHKTNEAKVKVKAC